MMAFIIIAQLVLDGGLRRVESSVGASTKVLLAETYKELATVSCLGLWTGFVVAMRYELVCSIDWASTSAP